ncbi:GGDEF domain-containing protein [Terribacillus sp. DMT04]|uniref:sensor domain-containing diguanylate cyclase n=1 Tax=Terribacillus sp. DMT04 TaxID=2850441 RepID=UPI001C2CC13A|nr:GGDEF domain-containing protein [Terribacillus sp. DMT04]QXE02451.1 GGDEF domain-containing protein [Terribacillus sp. DMT04]
MGIMQAFTLPPATKENKQKLRELILQENWKRTKLFAVIIMFFEAILTIMQLPEGWDFYIVMYIGLFLAAGIYLIVGNLMERKHASIRSRMQFMHFFVFLFLVWGTMITLQDQLHYGHVMAFVVNYMCVSALFLTERKRYILIALPSVALLYVGLPIYQVEAGMLFGHYVNVSVFIFFCWLASQLLYNGFAANFYNKLLLTDMNKALEVQIQQNEVMNDKLKKQATMDELTGILNRRGFQSYIYTMLADGSKRELSLFLLDVDAFKSYNDHYGHLRGDEVLRSIAQSVHQEAAIPTAGWARYGGEEFVLAIFDHPDEKLKETAEAIRRSVISLHIDHAYSPAAENVTVSIGVYSASISDYEQLSHFLGQADEALYEAKRAGRNTVKHKEELSGSYA